MIKHHPTNRSERLVVKKVKFEKKPKIKDRAGHVRHKLELEHTKEVEAEDELITYLHEGSVS